MRAKPISPDRLAVAIALRADDACAVLSISRSVGRAGVSNTRGGTFAARMAAWLKAQGFDGIDKGTRCRLLKIIDQIPAVQSWRETLPIEERLKNNHPNCVWRKYSSPKPKPKKKKTTPGSSSLPLDDRNLLAKILGMLGSDNPGVVGNAISQAQRILNKHNLDWYDVLGCSPKEKTRRAA